VEAFRRIRLLLVDDQPAVLRGLRMWLALEPDLMVVGEAASGADVGGLIESLLPPPWCTRCARRCRW
jgi:DNA-binding NarL/FixJ family response regulator